MIVFAFGLCVGSFLNVLIDRLPRGEQIIKGRSYCDHCRKSLSFFDLIPLLSFLLLKGRCRYCGKKISFYYPLVELITAISFILVFYYFKTQLLITIYLLLITSCLIVIFFADLKYGIIPDEMIITGIVATVLHIFISSYLHILSCQLFHCFVVSLLPGLLTAFFFLVLLLITYGRGMGLGDVKLSFLMGFLLGWPKIAVAIYLAFLTGALVGVILILIGKKKFGQIIPFGPFLVVGTFIAMFWGEKIIQVWLKLV